MLITINIVMQVTMKFFIEKKKCMPRIDERWKSAHELCEGKRRGRDFSENGKTK